MGITSIFGSDIDAFYNKFLEGEWDKISLIDGSDASILNLIAVINYMIS